MILATTVLLSRLNLFINTICLYLHAFINNCHAWYPTDVTLLLYYQLTTSMPINHHLLMLRLYRQDKAPRSVELLVFAKSENLLLVLQPRLQRVTQFVNNYKQCVSFAHVHVTLLWLLWRECFYRLYEVGYSSFYYLLLLERRETR